MMRPDASGQALGLLNLIHTEVHAVRVTGRPIIRIELHPDAEAMLLRELHSHEAEELGLRARLFGYSVRVRHPGRQFEVVVGQELEP